MLGYQGAKQSFSSINEFSKENNC